MGGLILVVNTLYMLSCFLKQFALVGKGLTKQQAHTWPMMKLYMYIVFTGGKWR